FARRERRRKRPAGSISVASRDGRLHHGPMALAMKASTPIRQRPHSHLICGGEHSVKFSFSAEQEEFRSNLRRFLADRSPTNEVRRLMETDDGYERDGWRSINAELGLTAIRIPEAYGGQGFGFGEQCIVLEEMGRILLCAPFFATAVLAAGAILNGGTETEKQALLPGIAAGETIATLAWVEDNGLWEAECTALAATEAGGGTVL